MNFEFLKTTAPIVFNQRFEQGNLSTNSEAKLAVAENHMQSLHAVFTTKGSGDPVCT